MNNVKYNQIIKNYNNTTRYWNFDQEPFKINLE